MQSALRGALLTLLLQATAVAGSYNWDIITHGLVSGWKYEKPWPHDDTEMTTFDEKCVASSTFKVAQYKFADLHKPPPQGLLPWADAIEDLATGRVYPGGWDGTNLKGKDREMLVLDYDHVPEIVRAWVDEQLSTEEGRNRHFFRVLEKPKMSGGRGAAKADEKVDWTKDLKDVPAHDKVFVTAPGELYQMLPLWVAKGSKCEDVLKDLTKYVATHAKEECVIAWPTDHSRKLLDDGHTQTTVRIEARWVKETDEGRNVRIYWEKHRQELLRQQRKYDREERAANRRGVEKERSGTKDEL